jgi:thiamine-phosphate pyrophosphorylase
VDVSRRAGWQPADLARAFLDGGAQCVQLRAKALSSDQFLELSDEIVAAADRYGALVVVNDRADLALMSGAGGVHVGQDDLPVGAVRALLGPQAIIGYSTHSVEQIEEASRQPASYIAVGPVFPTHTKETGYEQVGIRLVAEAVRRSRGVPVVAIGGITLDTAPAVWAAGATSVAIISDLLAGGDPRSRVASYNRLASADPRPGG